jgi:predicted transcriptional regulator
MALFAIIALVLFLLCYGGWELFKWRKGKKKREFEKTFDFKKYQILETIYKISKKTGKIAGMPVVKIAILERTNLSPKQFKELYQTMVKDELVTDQSSSLTLTDFGAKFFEIFVKKNKKI